MTVHTPTVSVVMAAYRGAALVRETIASLQAQTLGDFELIVVDDCSPDDTLAVLRSIEDPRIRVIAAERNQGPVHARNRAFAEARGRYIAALDQDDLCRPTRFARQVAWLDANPATVAVGSRAGLIVDGQRRPGFLPVAMSAGLIDWLLLIRNPLVWSSMMIRADVARRLDPFTRPDRLYAEDFDLYRRLRPFGPLARIDEELVDYRLHAGGVSVQFRETMIASAARVLSAAHAPLFGDASDDVAMLVTRHLSDGQPVTDGAALSRLAYAVEALFAWHLACAAPCAADELAIRGETSRLWWKLTRASVKAGALRLGPAIAQRTRSARWRQSGPAQLLLASLIGRGRSLGLIAASAAAQG